MSQIVDVLEDTWPQFERWWYGYAMRLTRSSADAEDIVQDAVVRTLQAEPELPNERAAKAYVMEAVKTSALKLYRSRSRARPDHEAERAVWREEIEPEDAPTPLEILLDEERVAERKDLIDRMHGELDRLPEDQRQAVELLVLREKPLKLREVAEIQDAPISTVHSRLQAGLRKLGEAVREGEEDVPDAGESS